MDMSINWNIDQVTEFHFLIDELWNITGFDDKTSQKLMIDLRKPLFVDNPVYNLLFCFQSWTEPVLTMSTYQMNQSDGGPRSSKYTRTQLCRRQQLGWCNFNCQVKLNVPLITSAVSLL